MDIVGDIEHCDLEYIELESELTVVLDSSPLSSSVDIQGECGGRKEEGKTVTDTLWIHMIGHGEVLA